MKRNHSLTHSDTATHRTVTTWVTISSAIVLALADATRDHDLYACFGPHLGVNVCVNVKSSNDRKLGRVFDLNCCSSELHKQPGERGALGPQHHSALEREPNNRVAMRNRRSPQEVYAHSAPAELKQDEHHRFKIPLWNLRREQQISRHVSSWYPIFPIHVSQTAGRAPGSPRIFPIPRAGPLTLPTVSSHGEFTAA